jgi:hypothetical protein
MAGESPRQPEEPINTYFDRSVFAFVVFWPVGIVAVVYSIMARASKRRGDLARAAEYATLAAAWGMAALGAFLVFVVGMFVAVVLFRGLL